MRRAWLLAWLAGCQLQLAPPPPDTQIACDAEARCPPQFGCLVARGRCVHEESDCVRAAGDVFEAANEGGPCFQEGRTGICSGGLCEPSRCGDGVVDALTGELCDDADEDDSDECTHLCLPPFCGDGVLSAGEQCDDNQVTDGRCLESCVVYCDSDLGNCNGDSADGCECEPEWLVRNLGGTMVDLELVGGPLGEGIEVLWASSGGLGRTRLADGVTTVFADTDDWVGGVATDGEHVYFCLLGDFDAPTGSIWRSAPDGTGLEELQGGLDYPQALVIDESSIYVAADGIWRFAKSGGDATQLVEDAYPAQLLIVGDHLYFTDDIKDRVSRVLLGGGPLEVVAYEQLGAFGIAADATHLYWANRGDILAASDERDGQIVSLAFAGGASTVLAEGFIEARYLAVDSSDVYWSNPSDEEVWRVSKQGGAPFLMTRGTLAAGPLLRDDLGLLLTEYGAIGRLPVP